MAEFTIKHLELSTGIKAHTIRIWEQRYQLFSPDRQGNNVRVYSNEDLQKILNISLLYKAGLKISKIAKLSNSQLQEKVKGLALTQPDGQTPGIQEQLIIAMINMDEPAFEKIISSQIIKFGFEKTITEVLFPFLNKTGLMWQIDMINPSQEHFASNIIRQKLIVAIDGQAALMNPKEKKYIFFLPENELHEFSLLFYNYIARSKGKNTIYLGQTVPIDGLEAIIKNINPNYLVTIITQPLEIEINHYLQNISSLFPSITVLASGYQVLNQNIESRQNLILFKNYKEFLNFV